jgi:DNA-binding NarL/FixJ family response regulator
LSDVTLRCLIVDDSARFAQAAVELLADEGIDVVGVANSSDGAVQMAAELHPDLALVDIDLGADSGLDLAHRLSGEGPARLAGAVILISTHAEEQFAELIAASPAVGFLPKTELSADAIEQLLKRSTPDRAD